MAVVFELNQSPPLSMPAKNNTGTPPLVKVLSSHEFSQLPHIPAEGREALATLELAASNFVELFPHFIVGSFAVPDKDHPTDDPDCLSFYLEKEHLIFIDDGTVALELLEKVRTSGILTEPTTAHCLYSVMKILITDDFTWLENIEDEMEDLEETLLDSAPDDTSQQIMAYRRAAMRMGSYYQQIAVMADLISDNENKIMSREEAHAFTHVVTHASHLCNRAEVLRDYSLQLRELYQTEIDLKQNSTMQVLTIVTVMIAPLTVITGWFGMNLQVLPGLDWPYMAGALIVFALVMITLMVIIFKKKNWM